MFLFPDKHLCRHTEITTHQSSVQMRFRMIDPHIPVFINPLATFPITTIRTYQSGYVIGDSSSSKTPTRKLHMTRFATCLLRSLSTSPTQKLSTIHASLILQQRLFRVKSVATLASSYQSTIGTILGVITMIVYRKFFIANNTFYIHILVYHTLVTLTNKRREDEQ